MYNILIYNSVRAEGLEPPYLTAPDPKSGVSTNFTTPAFFGTAKVGFKVEWLVIYFVNLIIR